MRGFYSKKNEIILISVELTIPLVGRTQIPCGKG